MIPQGHAKGNQGNWFADITAPRCPEIDGKSLPCIWDFWVEERGTRYRDPGYAPEQTKAIKVVESLRADGLAIMRRRKKPHEEGHWQSDGYIAVFRVTNVKFGDELTFDIVERMCDLR